jgi:hypothetical protein
MFSMINDWLINTSVFLNSREYTKDNNLRTEPKYIVFLSQFCPSCKSANPLVETSQHGTKVIVYTHCGNPNCKQSDSVWRSQPNMEGTKIAAGNFLLSFATLVAGASISKVQRVLRHMGVACISLSTFFRHQKVSWSYKQDYTF